MPQTQQLNETEELIRMALEAGRSPEQIADMIAPRTKQVTGRRDVLYAGVLPRPRLQTVLMERGGRQVPVQVLRQHPAEEHIYRQFETPMTPREREPVVKRIAQVLGTRQAMLTEAKERKRKEESEKLREEVKIRAEAPMKPGEKERLEFAETREQRLEREGQAREKWRKVGATMKAGKLGGETIGRWQAARARTGLLGRQKQEKTQAGYDRQWNAIVADLSEGASALNSPEELLNIAQQYWSAAPAYWQEQGKMTSPDEFAKRLEKEPRIQRRLKLRGEQKEAEATSKREVSQKGVLTDLTKFVVVRMRKDTMGGVDISDPAYLQQVADDLWNDPVLNKKLSGLGIAGPEHLANMLAEDYDIRAAMYEPGLPPKE